MLGINIIIFFDGKGDGYILNGGKAFYLRPFFCQGFSQVYGTMAIARSEVAEVSR